LHDWLLLYNLTSSIGHATLAASSLFMPHKLFHSQCELALLVGSGKSQKKKRSLTQAGIAGYGYGHHPHIVQTLDVVKG
jgi:hypothetical protein